MRRQGGRGAALPGGFGVVKGPAAHLDDLVQRLEVLVAEREDHPAGVRVLPPALHRRIAHARHLRPEPSVRILWITQGSVKGADITAQTLTIYCMSHVAETAMHIGAADERKGLAACHGRPVQAGPLQALADLAWQSGRMHRKQRGLQVRVRPITALRARLLALAGHLVLAGHDLHEVGAVGAPVQGLGSG